MPELPEVEVTRRSFADAITGAKILAVKLGKPLRWPLGCAPDKLIGQTIFGVRRRGKYLLMDMGQGLLLLHLGMSGSLRFAPTLPVLGVHDHFELTTTHGILRLNDPRRFGAAVYVTSEHDAMALKLLGHLGMEPLSNEFIFEKFQSGLKTSRSPIKQVLLAGRLVVGVGNIYASEVLFMAGICPAAAASSISIPRARRLHEAIQQVLSAAVAVGGSTLRNFSSADGSAGHFQQQTQVYGREAAPCHTCGTRVCMVRQAQRSTYYCPQCQCP